MIQPIVAEQCIVQHALIMYLTLLLCFQIVLTLLVVIWGLRLALFLLMRYD